ncbi:MAG: hypothetical protein LBS74_10660 [Oscillospiraceae bacterium]|jgi:hypothetical protein|nr:hypothetical protein [Oscillospiraceae bacterium]
MLNKIGETIPYPIIFFVAIMAGIDIIKDFKKSDFWKNVGMLSILLGVIFFGFLKMAMQYKWANFVRVIFFFGFLFCIISLMIALAIAIRKKAKSPSPLLK